MRFKEKERHDLKHGIRDKKLAVRNIVLLYDIQRKKDMLRKYIFKWLSKYQISYAVRDKSTYMLEKLNGL